MLNISRIIQVLGAGASSSLWRSLLRDTYSTADMAKYSGYLATAITITIPFAPLVGGVFASNI